MSKTTDNNKRIAKNTLLLYVRMLLLMLVSLYTSRLVLNTLGVEDYGIYNVVAGVILMLNFLTNSLGGASSRYITYDLGKGDINVMKKTFGNIISIHLLLAIIIIILGETIGLWFMTTQLQIPEERETAAFWVYQFSIFSSVMSVISVPYNASIIAHERMSAFAYLSIIDAILKLIIVYLLLIISYDKLITYSALFLCIQIFDRIVYSVYCRKHFKETRSKPCFDKQQFKEIFAFAGWTLNGNLAVMGLTQGINMLLNMFFGPIVNAARGISVQVQSTVQSFCTNFQMALNPQLTKSYAIKDLTNMHQLLKASSKISYFLIFFISLPIMLKTPLILRWWLGIVPEHTVNFLRLILWPSIFYTLSNPLVVSIHATGNIKRFQLIEGSILLCIVPISYLLLKFFHIPPELVFIVQIIIELCALYARLRIVLPMISMQISDYIINVIYPITKVTLIAPIIPIIINCYMKENILSFFIVCIASICCVFITAYYWGCSVSERYFINKKIKDILNKIK